MAGTQAALKQRIETGVGSAAATYRISASATTTTRLLPLVLADFSLESAGRPWLQEEEAAATTTTFAARTPTARRFGDQIATVRMLGRNPLLA